ncbi:MAG: Ppx/GppA phosphatase family protein [Deinococcota bacterium]
MSDAQQVPITITQNISNDEPVVVRPEERVAIIDLGSNTCKLILMAYQTDYSYRQVDELRQVVRLAEGMGSANILRADAFERGINVLKNYHTYCQAAGISDIIATATSAVRDAKNGASFLAAAKEQAGLSPVILSGEEEAYYGVLAVANSLNVDNGFILDIGGGSAQLSEVKARNFVQGQSWPLGALRLTEQFFNHANNDPPKKKEIKALEKHIKTQLETIPENFATAETLVGMGGTIRNLAKIQQKRDDYCLDLKHSYKFQEAHLADIVDMLVEASTADRKNISGLSGDRADIILAGAIVAREMLARSAAKAITISGQGVREGLFYSRFVEGDTHLLENMRQFSVVNLMRRYYNNVPHNEHVCKLALALFDGLTSLHGYGESERELLAAAALLHDIGMAVSYYDHHKHGFYLTMGTALPGYSHREQVVIGLLVRYHRKGTPNDEGYGGLLEADDMLRIHKLAALLRLAEYLERSKAQRVKDVRCHVSDDYVQLEVLAEDDIGIELHEARNRAGLFASAYDVRVDIIGVSA